MQIASSLQVCLLHGNVNGRHHQGLWWGLSDRLQRALVWCSEQGSCSASVLRETCHLPMLPATRSCSVGDIPWASACALGSAFSRVSGVLGRCQESTGQCSSAASTLRSQLPTGSPHCGHCFQATNVQGLTGSSGKEGSTLGETGVQSGELEEDSGTEALGGTIRYFLTVELLVLDGTGLDKSRWGWHSQASG